MEEELVKVRGYSEVFTGCRIVEKMLDDFPAEVWEEGKTFVDPECGIGQFLVGIAKRKLDFGHTKVLSTIYGVDIMPDNVEECRCRLLEICGDTNENRAIVERHIQCKNTLEYDFNFGDNNEDGN